MLEPPAPGLSSDLPFSVIGQPCPGRSCAGKPIPIDIKGPDSVNTFKLSSSIDFNPDDTDNLFHYVACGLAPTDDDQGTQSENLQQEVLPTDVFHNYDEHFSLPVLTDLSVPSGVPYNHHATLNLPALADVSSASPISARSTPGSSPDVFTSSQQRVSNALSKQAQIIKQIWPSPTPSAGLQFPQFVDEYNRIKARLAPNYIGAKIPINSDLNIQEWERRLARYHDAELCQFLKFGWPLGYHSFRPPESVTENHPSALNHPGPVNKYIETELSFKAILGPFKEPPFDTWCRVSPMMTRPK